MSHADLIKTVISNSDSKTWREARLEWFVKSMDEDESLESTCVCGHEHLRYLYTIENKINGEIALSNNPSINTEPIVISRNGDNFHIVDTRFSNA